MHFCINCVVLYFKCWCFLGGLPIKLNIGEHWANIKHFDVKGRWKKTLHVWMLPPITLLNDFSPYYVFDQSCSSWMPFGRKRKSFFPQFSDLFMYLLITITKYCDSLQLFLCIIVQIPIFFMSRKNLCFLFFEVCDIWDWTIYNGTITRTGLEPELTKTILDWIPYLKPEAITEINQSQFLIFCAVFSQVRGLFSTRQIAIYCSN